MKKSILFYLPKMNSYFDRILTISNVKKHKINFVFIENENKSLSKKLKEKGHNVFFISKIIKSKILRLLLNPLIIIFLSIKTKSKIVHLTSYVANPLLIKIFCKLTNRKYFVSLFCLYSSRYPLFKEFSFFKKITSPQIRRMYFFSIHEYVLLQFVDNLIMQAHGIANNLPQYAKYKDKIKIIPNAIEIDSKLPEWNLKHESFKKNSLNILYAGGIDHTRGVDILINAFNEMCTMEQDVRLTLIGDKGDYFSEKIKFLNPKKVNIFPKLKRENFYLEVLKNDVFIYPSKNEGSPRIILEMLSIGIPIFASSLPGIIELDKNKEFINYINDKKSIIKKLIEFKDNPNSFYKRSFKGRSYVRNHNSTKYISQKYEDLYS